MFSVFFQFSVFSFSSFFFPHRLFFLITIFQGMGCFFFIDRWIFSIFFLKGFVLLLLFILPDLYFYTGIGLLKVRGNLCDCSSCFRYECTWKVDFFDRNGMEFEMVS